MIHGWLTVVVSTLVTFTSCQAPLGDDFHSSLAENAAHLRFATGSNDITDRIQDKTKRHPWPFEPIALGHSMASYQNYGNDPYFHHGLDIVGNVGASVRASTGGRVVDVRNYRNGPLYWEVAILDDEGYIWQYHHIDRETIPERVLTLFRNGGRVNTGDEIGKIVRWPQLMARQAYHHIHLNVLAQDGVYVNPFAFLQPLPDGSAPVINDIGILQGKQRVSGTTATSSYSLYADVSDVIMGQSFTVPPYRITLEINGTSHNVWTFNSLPGKSSRRDFINDFYIVDSNSTCGNYTCRRHVINLGFSKDAQNRLPKYDGQHNIEVIAADFAGNTTRKSFTYRVEGLGQPPENEYSALWLAVTEVDNKPMGFVSGSSKLHGVRICQGTWQTCQENHANLPVATPIANRTNQRNIFSGLNFNTIQNPTTFTLLGLDREKNITAHREIRVTRN